MSQRQMIIYKVVSFAAIETPLVVLTRQSISFEFNAGRSQSINVCYDTLLKDCFFLCLKDNKQDLERLKKYLYAGQSEEVKLLKEFYVLDEKK